MPMERKDVLAEAAKIAAAVKAIYAKAKGIHGGIKGIYKAAPAVVEQVEIAAKAWAGVTSENKKAMAVEAILLMVKLPWWLPKFVARSLISWAIESALTALKKAGIGAFKIK